MLIKSNHKLLSLFTFLNTVHSKLSSWKVSKENRGQAFTGRDKYTCIKHHIYSVLSKKRSSSYNSFSSIITPKNLISTKIQLLYTNYFVSFPIHLKPYFHQILKVPCFQKFH